MLLFYTRILSSTPETPRLDLDFESPFYLAQVKLECSPNLMPWITMLNLVWTIKALQCSPRPTPPVRSGRSFARFRTADTVEDSLNFLGQIKHKWFRKKQTNRTNYHNIYKPHGIQRQDIKIDAAIRQCIALCKCCEYYNKKTQMHSRVHK